MTGSPILLRFRQLLLAYIGATVLGACTNVQMAPREESEAARQMPVPPDKAFVFLYRPEMWAATNGFAVLVNGQPIGVTAAKSYFLIETPPGEVTLVSKAANTVDLKLTVEAGKRYYVLQDVDLLLTMFLEAMVVRISMVVVDEGRGRQGVAGTNLIHHVKL